MPDQTPHSLRKFLPTFRIPEGMHVVLGVNKLSGEGVLRPRCSVGVVAAAPAENTLPYRVAFADGMELEAFAHELSERRREVRGDTSI